MRITIDGLTSNFMENSLLNYIKYCLGYIKLTRERTVAAQQKYSVNLPTEYFGLSGLLNGDTDDSVGELVDLKTFYDYDPKDIPENLTDNFKKEKELASKILDIYNRYLNDQYTKQINFNFGYFDVELPIEGGDIGSVLENDEDVEPQKTLFNNEEAKNHKTKTDRYPLFALPVRIEKEIGKGGIGRYFIYPIDSEIQVNIGILESILGEALYFQLLEVMGKYEVEGRLTLPITDIEVFKEIWHLIKDKLKYTEAVFNEGSFLLEEFKITLGPKVNYFLAEDLAKISKLSEEELSKTALTSWTKDDELNVEGNAPHENDLYFPFLYDKSQLKTLSIIGNKAAIIQGPPGTGKSETISNILCHLAATGKRVLFVSQKAQALKVVKDKLKKLNVKYLYGYLPNPKSAQVGEEDEADGIAPQLSALGAYIDKLGYERGYNGAGTVSPLIRQSVKNRDDFRNELNSIIETQRKYYQLHQELIQLKKYNIDISDFGCFAKSFSSVEWREIKNSKTEIELLGKIIKKYESSDKKKEFDRIFVGMDLNGKKYVELIYKIREDVAKTGFDRHSNFFRKINNTRRNLRLRRIYEKLPREIIDHLDGILNSNVSRNEANKLIENLHNHCCFYENIQRLENVKEKLKSKLITCGVSDDQFAVVDGLIDNAKSVELEEVKNKILRVQEIKTELQKLSKTENANKIVSALNCVGQERREQVAIYIQNIINTNITEKWKQGVTIKQIIRKLASAFGKSKKAFKTFDNLRKDADNFNAILDLIPVWIMELDDASRIIPLEAGIFDYVILDEASQCNVAYTLPVMYRSSHALFVGDSEQMRDNNILFKSGKVLDDLARKYQIPEEKQIKASGSAVQSVLDIAYKRGFMDKFLCYHYRSPAELIGFSNKYFYKPKGKELIPINSNYLTYKDTNRVMVVHEVESNWSEEFSDNVNVAEAKTILTLFKELREDERYSGKSIGILAFFNNQATFIRDLFEKEGLKEEEDNYKVSITEGIQGDEKDIIIYSFVIRSPDQKKRYVPLTGEGGDIQADINKGRVNVAFTRARLQTHCFVSLPPQQMPDKIWLKKYLEYVQENGEISFYSTDLKPFDSMFEERFYYDLLIPNFRQGYKIQNQVKSCGFKIDFVVSNTNTGKRIAVECDGPCHFKDEIDEAYGIYIESDEERQRVLETAGWRFYRIKYSEWIEKIFDKNIVVQTMIDLLK